MKVKQRKTFIPGGQGSPEWGWGNDGKDTKMTAKDQRGGVSGLHRSHASATCSLPPGYSNEENDKSEKKKSLQILRDSIRLCKRDGLASEWNPVTL